MEAQKRWRRIRGFGCLAKVIGGSGVQGREHSISKQPEAAVAVLHNDVLPFYEAHGLKVEAVLTDNGTEFRGVAAIRTRATWSSTTARCWRSSSG